MKNNAVSTLVKDVLIAAIAWGIGVMFFTSGFAMDANTAYGAACLAACIPFGWRWASKIITAYTLKGIGIKLLISVFLGMFAIFVVLGMDVVRCLGQLLTARKRTVRAAVAE